MKIGCYSNVYVWTNNGPWDGKAIGVCDTRNRWDEGNLDITVAERPKKGAK